MDNEHSIRLVSRVISILKSFNPKGLELSYSDISKKTGIPKVTTYRIVKNLTSGGLLEWSTTTGKYRIGTELYILGNLYLSTTDITKFASPVIKTLNDLSKETVNVGIYNNGNVILVALEESKSVFRISYNIGSMLPAHSTSLGKAFMSQMTEAEIDRLYPGEELRVITEKTIATKTNLKKNLEQIRKTGISISKEENTKGAAGISSLILDANGKAVAVLNISLPVSKLNQSKCERLSQLVKLGSSLISYRLGYRDIVYPVHNVQEIRDWWEQKYSVPANKKPKNI